jgi:hypothetical protein
MRHEVISLLLAIVGGESGKIGGSRECQKLMERHLSLYVCI